MGIFSKIDINMQVIVIGHPARRMENDSMANLRTFWIEWPLKGQG
jgi:hypothetical protein